MILRVDESGDLDEVEQGSLLQQTSFRSGSLYEDSNDVFRLESEVEIEDDAGNVLMFLLTVGGGLQVHAPQCSENQFNYTANDSNISIGIPLTQSRELGL